MIENLKLTLYLTTIGIIFAIIAVILIKRKRIIIYNYTKVFICILIVSIILVGFGYKLNDFVVNQNNGKMPVAVSDIDKVTDDGRHCLSTSNVKFEILTDIFCIKFPVEGMYSIGDIISGVGWITFISVLGIIILMALQDKIKK
ncbi:DUF5317 family protein [Clostridium botulinum]|uniref:DUF5317 family protein n=1 Tax=Clostridium botulinum TaxID=1491 RepID=UPI00064CCDE1|nr:DUF5317 family protein [Clostridium botulinum]KLU76036.1 hypothetical protein CBC3_06135 [Clostridium botulinum V891]KOA72891.1 hypothetical protein ADU78_13815 [Clostridium botulinum]KOA93024.1 hypothetical protein ADU76_07105 [Clostridium botulinum]KOC31188.1 hypothetical protein ADU81_14145 [Clostridium botulinum]MCD3204202.1 DUF5317 domain-containing protein [Clostridium botulinum C/D]